ncbi:hypothetical protein D3C71_152690 [compost metagenome]
MVSDATNAKRDFVKEWIGGAHPEDVAELTQRRMSYITKPEFENAGRVHDWRNHVGEATQSLWGTFTDQQKAAIALDAEESASREEWE